MLDLGRLLTAPAGDNDTSAVEVGVKFRSDERRLHHRRSASTRAPATPAPTSAPVDDRRHPARRGHVQRARPPPAGSRSASPRRWRSTPNTTYVASYHTPNGHYAASDDYFATGGSTTRRCTRSATAWTGQRRLPLRRRRQLPDRHLPVDQLLGRRRLRRRPSGPTPRRRRSPRDARRRRDRRRRPAPTSPPPSASRWTPATSAANDVRAARPLERARPGHRDVRRRRREGRSSPRTAPLAHSTTYTATVQGGRRRRHGRRSRQRARRRLHLVLHHRRATAATSRRRAGRPILVIQRSEPVQPLLRRDPAHRGLNEFTSMDIGNVTAATLERARRRDPRETAVSDAQAQMLSTGCRGAAT